MFYTPGARVLSVLSCAWFSFTLGQACFRCGIVGTRSPKCHYRRSVSSLEGNVSGYDCNPCSPRKGTRHCVSLPHLSMLGAACFIAKLTLLCAGIPLYLPSMRHMLRHDATPIRIGIVSFMLQTRYVEGDSPTCRYRCSVSFPFSANKGYSCNQRRYSLWNLNEKIFLPRTKWNENILLLICVFNSLGDLHRAVACLTD